MKMVFLFYGMFLLSGCAGIKSAQKPLMARCNEGSIQDCLTVGLFEEDSGNPLEAKKWYKRVCDADPTKSCFLLGLLKESVPKSKGEKNETIDSKETQAKILTTLESACREEKSHACFYLGLRERNKGNQYESGIFFQKACEKKEFRGCRYLGLIFEMKSQIARAHELFKQGCEGDEMKSCYHLALAEKDPDKKKQLLKNACESSEMQSCLKLAEIESNKDEAKKLLETACAGEAFEGCRTLAALELEKGDKIAATKFFKMACEGEDLLSCEKLGDIEIEKGNIDEAKKLYQMVCDGGKTWSCLNLIEIELEHGSKAKALLFARKLCQNGRNGWGTDACLYLGQMQQRLGKTRIARRIFELACEEGSEEGCSLLDDSLDMPIQIK